MEQDLPNHLDRPETSLPRTGLVALVGRANVGKSTLLNALVRQHVSIVSSRPQTTRHAIHGVIHAAEGQVVLVDTPGFYQTHRSALVDRLHGRSHQALLEADALLHVVDPARAPGPEEDLVRQAMSGVSAPRILCLNKSDLRSRPHRKHWLDQAAEYSSVLEVSARTGENLPLLVKALLDLLPAGAPLYEPGQVTNAGREFRMAEVVREKIYQLTSEEVPYRTAVRVDEIVEVPESGRRGRLQVRATILVAHDRYKAMLIGARGGMIRSVRTSARGDLERLFDQRISLELTVRVDPRID